MTKVRNDQNWIFDNFLKLSDNEDTLHPGVLAQRLERGYKYHDLQRVYSRVSGRRSYSKSWAQEGKRLQSLAERSMSNETRAQFYHRASMCWGRAQHTIKGSTNPQKVHYYQQMEMCWELFCKCSKLNITNGKTKNSRFVFIDCPNAIATVLICPGMDQFAQEVVFPYNNPWLERGFNVLIVEGPGHASQRMLDNHLSVTGMTDAVHEVMEIYKQLPFVIFGMSFGTRWAIEAAADKQDEIACVCGQMANVGSTQNIFNFAQPNFARIFMEMTGITNEEEFESYSQSIDSYHHEQSSKLTVPYLLVTGEQDELCSPEQVEQFIKEHIPHGEVWIYEDCFHVMGEVCGDIYAQIADWAKLCVLGDSGHIKSGINWIAQDGLSKGQQF
jgi:alpha-beta hydrolase superfamily lysophospholipase